jgi:outer membrane protein OmpA-like peptidoglycan-associated protein
MIESLMGLVTPQIVNSLSSRLGESPTGVQEGLKTSAIAMLSSLAGRSSEPGFMGQIFSLLNSSGNEGSLGNLASIAANGLSAGPLSDLASKFTGLALGSKESQSSIGSAIARAAGVSPASASGLLSMAAPLLLGFLKQNASSATGLASMLSGEASNLQRLLPAGLGSLLSGVGALSGAAKMAGSAARDVAAETASAGSKWLWPLLLILLAVAGLIWFLTRGADKAADVAKETASKAAETATVATSAVTDAAKSAWAALGEFFKRKLPNGVELNIPQLGVENRLIGYIEDVARPIDKTTWFDFDRLLFDTGKSTLQPVSQEQLQNIAEILKAFPKVKIKIGGYTDNTGDKAANLKLSEARAQNVQAELIRMGIDASRLSAEGYGDQFPIGDNATEEGRAKNRRISMRVIEK